MTSQTSSSETELEELRRKVEWLEIEVANLKAQRDSWHFNQYPTQAAAGCGWPQPVIYTELTAKPFVTYIKPAPGAAGVSSTWIEVPPAQNTGITPEWQRNAFAGTSPQ